LKLKTIIPFSSLTIPFLILAALILLAPMIFNHAAIHPPEDAIDIPAQSDWVDYGTIFKAGAVGEWDHLLWGGFANSIIQKDGVFYYYYQGSSFYRTEFDPSVMWRSIGVAISTDGINFTKYTANPILTWFPNNNGEEGAVSSGATVGEDGMITLYYGANTEESGTTVNANGRVAVSSDGLTFNDLGVVLNHTNPLVWGYGDELFPVDAIYDQGRWVVYYIPNGVLQSGQLGVAYGDQMDVLGNSSQVKSGNKPISVWGTVGHVKIGNGQYALILNNVRANKTEVRLMSMDEPNRLSEPVVTYQLESNQQATLLLDEERKTWFMFYRYEDGYGVKLAPAGVPDHSPPSAPRKVVGIMIEDEIVDLNWQPAEDPDTGIVQYVIYRNGVKIGTTRGKFFSDTDPNRGNNASYQISAVNFHGFEGQKSPSAQVKRSCLSVD
jgi:hypothetical protein